MLYNWKDDWALQESFSISIDSEGYRFPTSIAFIPHPGPGPKDPLYFVTELPGTVKVVTNDRSVYTFAENFFKVRPAKELPARGGEVGMAGICLDEKRGYVFVTFAYHNNQGLIYNNMVRFTTQPRSFSLTPGSQVAFTDIFSSDQGAVSHQIGNCQVVDDSIYVGVGDGERPFLSRRFDSVLGKVLRMTLDGKPDITNPFYQDENVKNPTNYIYAYGLRNPFGLRVIDGRLFVADNGTDLDRFIKVQSGGDYLWDGTSRSIGNKALSVITSVGFVQTEFHPENIEVFPQRYRKRFYVATSGEPSKKGRKAGAIKGILSFDFDFENETIRTPPEYFVRYRGNDFQSVVGVALGPDALYFVPLFANKQGKSYVLKVNYDPVSKHKNIIARERTPELLLTQKGCLDCHSQDPQKEIKGPTLHRETMLAEIQNRLQSQHYIQRQKRLDQTDEEPYFQYRAARKEILESNGVEQVHLWMQYHLMEPKFDNPDAQMPNLGLDAEEANVLTSYLLKATRKPPLLLRFKEAARNAIFKPKFKHVIASFLSGIFCTVLLLLISPFRSFIRNRFFR